MFGNARLLIVDDEEVVCEACRRILSPHGFRVDTTTDAIEGLFRAMESDYAAILLDIKMTSLDGIRLLEHLRRTKPDVAVVFITGYPNVQHAAAAMRLGAADYVTKPFAPDELIRVVQEVLRSPNQKGSSRSRASSWALDPWAPTDRELLFWDESWLHSGKDGSVRVGSVLAHRRRTHPESVRLPPVGETIYQGLPLAGLTIPGEPQRIVPSPISGVVVAVNQLAVKRPLVLTRDAFHDGWLARICPSRFEEEVKNCHPRRVALVNADHSSARGQSEALVSLGCQVSILDRWQRLTPSLLARRGTLLMFDAASFGERGPELVGRINVAAPSMRIVVIAPADSRLESAYRGRRILYYAVEPFDDDEIADILDTAFRCPRRPLPRPPRSGGAANSVTAISITNGTGRKVRLLGENRLLRRDSGLGRELADKLRERRCGVEMAEGGNVPITASTVREAAHTCDRLLVLLAKDMGRLPGSLVRDTWGEFTSELCPNTWNVTPLIVQPPLTNDPSLDFDARTTVALAEHIMQEMVLCCRNVGNSPAPA